MTKVHTGVNRVPCVLNKYGEHGPEYVPILEMYESYSGWLWYITEFDEQDSDLAFGFIHGLEDNWGHIYMPELRDVYRIWKVPRNYWPFDSRVKMIPKDQLREYYETTVSEVVGKEIILEKTRVSMNTARAIKQAKCFIFE